MELNAAITAKLNAAFQSDEYPYVNGFRDALESFALALQGTIPEGLLMDALETALDAYANNVDQDDEYENDGPDFYEYEDDGQPSERQEWFDYDPDC